MIYHSDLSVSLNIWSSVIVMLFLITILIVFMTKWRHDCIPIMQVLAVFLVNQILYSGAEVLAYIDQTNNVLCTISIIGIMAFGVAANFWIIFVTRLIYRQALAPGKYFNLVNFVLKNVIMTYIPSLILSVFLLIIIFVSESESESKCWQIITNTQFLDYIIYGLAFILPDLVTSVIIISYLYKLYRLESGKWTFFLSFSFTSLIFSIYYLIVKIIQFTNQQEMGYFNAFMLLEPIMYGVYFIVIYIRQRNKAINSTQYTIRGSEGQVSFIEDL